MHEVLHEPFIDNFATRKGKIKVGHGLDEGKQMGPMIAARRLDVMDGLVADAKSHGAEVIMDGERIGNNGYFYAPTLLKNVPDSATIMSEELVGPIAPTAEPHFGGVNESGEGSESGLEGLEAYMRTKFVTEM